MDLIIRLIAGLVAAIHGYIMWLEMFAWTTRGPKAFNKPIAELEKGQNTGSKPGVIQWFPCRRFVMDVFYKRLLLAKQYHLIFFDLRGSSGMLWRCYCNQKDILYPVCTCTGGNCFDSDHQVKVYRISDFQFRICF